LIRRQHRFQIFTNERTEISHYFEHHLLEL